MKLATEFTKSAKDAPDRPVTFELVKEDPRHDHTRLGDDHNLQSEINNLTKVASKIKTETYRLDSEGKIALDIGLISHELIASLKTPNDTLHNTLRANSNAEKMLFHTTFSDPHSSLLITVHTCVSLTLDYHGPKPMFTFLPSHCFPLILSSLCSGVPASADLP